MEAGVTCQNIIFVIIYKENNQLKQSGQSARTAYYFNGLLIFAYSNGLIPLSLFASRKSAHHCSISRRSSRCSAYGYTQHVHHYAPDGSSDVPQHRGTTNLIQSMHCTPSPGIHGHRHPGLCHTPSPSGLYLQYLYERILFARHPLF
ncbi:Uncharacterised protein [Escherichia coli]|uniref:Uncharacterized protein n=1 Tax=Escherichia coli TaxID=562 RepID=A0A376NZ06_ECOLX|nr:Uncharacterised protein [Escherichia coli]